MMKQPYIIAEAGFNHDGDMDQACRMIEEAAKAGADAIKFQSFRAEDLCTRTSEHYQLIKKGEISRDNHRMLIECASRCGIDFLSTPYGQESADLLDELGVGAFKVASMDLTNIPFLAHLAAKDKKIYLSTGMSLICEIDQAVSVLIENGAREIVLLHCISNYPAAPEDLNLLILETLRKIWKLPVGYSDHSLGIYSALAATALGAEVVEKHFTLDKNLPGPDHKIAADPADLSLLVKGCREIAKCLGAGVISPARADRANATVFRRGIYAARKIEAGEILQMDMLKFIRPADTLSPGDVKFILGRKARKTIEEDTPVRPEFF